MKILKKLMFCVTVVLTSIVFGDDGYSLETYISNNKDLIASGDLIVVDRNELLKSCPERIIDHYFHGKKGVVDPDTYRALKYGQLKDPFTWLHDIQADDADTVGVKKVAVEFISWDYSIKNYNQIGFLLELSTHKDPSIKLVTKNMNVELSFTNITISSNGVSFDFASLVTTLDPKSNMFFPTKKVEYHISDLVSQKTMSLSNSLHMIPLYENNVKDKLLKKSNFVYLIGPVFFKVL